MRKLATAVALFTLAVSLAFAGEITGYNTVTGNGTGGATGFVCNVEAVTNGVGDPNILTAPESGKLITNEGATALTYNTLPTAASGAWFRIYVQDADGIRVTCGADDTIRIDGIESSAAGYMESTTAGSGMIVTAINATEWVVTTMPAGSRAEWNVDGTPTGFGASGSFWFSTPSATANGVNDIVKAAGTTTAIGAPRAFTHSGTNRLTYNGLKTIKFLVTVSVSVTKASGGSTLAGLTLLEGGSAVTGVIVDRQVGNVDEGAWGVTAEVELATDEYIELGCRSSTGDDLTVESGVLTITTSSVN